MGSYTINDDGSVTIPIKGREPIVLQEPSMWELAEMHKLVSTADEELGQLGVLPEDPTPELLEERRKENIARTEVAFSHESPHGKAMVEIIKLLVPGTELSEKELPGWLCHPQTANTLLVHFRTPLPGAE